MRAGRAAFALFVAALVLYAPSLANGLTNWDDPKYVDENAIAQKGLSGLKDAFTQPFDGAYYPLTQAAYCVIQAVAGPSPLAHHLVSWLLFALTVALVPLALRAFGVPLLPATLAAFLWMAHPFRAEHVAWAANLKDALSALFVVASFAAYGKQRRAIAAVLFALAVLSKSMVFPLALLFVALEWAKGDRPWRALRAQWAFVLIGIADALVAGALHAGFVRVKGQAFVGGTLLGSVPTVLWRPWWYLGRILWPWEPRAIYDPGAVHWNDVRLWLAVALWAALVAFVVTRQGTRRWAVLTVLAYLLPIAAVLGLVPMGFYAADRYTLFPSLVVATLAGILLARTLRTPQRAAVAAGVLMVPLSIGSVNAQRQWRDGVTLWEANLRAGPDTFEVRYNLGGAYGGAGRWDDAIEQLHRALALAPERRHVLEDLLFAYAGKDGAPWPQIESWLALARKDGWAPKSLLTAAAAALAQGHPEVARRVADDVMLSGERADALTLKAKCARMQKQFEVAAAAAKRAVELQPDLDAARAEWVVALAELGRLNEALREAEPRSSNPKARALVTGAKAFVLFKQGRELEAQMLLREAKKELVP